ncbi:CheR family methyltransferase [Chitinimonas koreensis]|uniref:CheR family methyltransferase n=1 Tax=Chitinimonas koreensis TaxID=356302 RepID=UPI000413BC9B|nr:CheR family methyltransferase [Chitinimonas koreensis]QNM94784.1 protein-glutamate O-methyltransferase CheR [Chitinimonas koreensis]
MIEAPSDFDIELHLLVEAIYLKYRYDFRDYAVSSLRRRVRHALGQFGCATVSALQERVLHQPETFTRLLQLLTVPVSEMFRDAAYFLAVREQVVPILRTYPSLKVWVAGCSTGEEVYSLAIVLDEEGLLERSVIYATDINPHTLERAQQGMFPLDRMPLYGDNYRKSGGRRALSDYYTASQRATLFSKALREHITFADHSLATDSVFSETHFISCRNVMIYFNRQLQDRAIGLFADSLCHKGFLGLGQRETVQFSAHAARFEVFDKPARIFRKN